MSGDASKFRVAANHIIGINRFGRKELSERDWHHHFGVSIDTCCKLWYLCEFPKKTKHKHVLWALMLMRLYDNNVTLSASVKCSPKTFSKWTKIVIEVISKQRIFLHYK